MGTYNSHYNLKIKFTEFDHVYKVNGKMVFILMGSISYLCPKTLAGHKHKSTWLWVVISGIHGPELKDNDNSDNDPSVTKIVANCSVDCGRSLVLGCIETVLPLQAVACVFVKWVLSKGLATKIFSPQHRC
jgi:hypothetical protein